MTPRFYECFSILAGDVDAGPLFSIYLFDVFAFILGACVGSFLNVCIYRLPLNLSVNEPKRSFCPSCKYQIPWSRNLPLISWLSLRGKCANCGARISFRYFGVELLTAAMFLAIWLKCSLPGGHILFAPAYWVFASLLIVATFIDFEHFIIPDEITIGGTVAGIVFSAAIPSLMGQEVFWKGALWSAIGAAAGWCVLRGVVEFGKLAFGKKVARYESPTPFTWKHLGEDADLEVSGEILKWTEIFSRDSDQLVLKCTAAEIAGKEYRDLPLHFYFHKLVVGGDEYKIDDLKEIRGKVSEIVIPREGMGLGDVKFIAAIGAFLGWQSVFFTIASASIIGAVVGTATLLLNRKDFSTKIPFGPYLTLGAVIWMFAGWDIVHWYLDKVIGSP